MQLFYSRLSVQGTRVMMEASREIAKVFISELASPFGEFYALKYVCKSAFDSHQIHTALT